MVRCNETSCYLVVNLKLLIFNLPRHSFMHMHYIPVPWFLLHNTPAYLNFGLGKGSPIALSWPRPSFFFDVVLLPRDAGSWVFFWPTRLTAPPPPGKPPPLALPACHPVVEAVPLPPHRTVTHRRTRPPPTLSSSMSGPIVASDSLET
jgi:hypothetical protein